VLIKHIVSREPGKMTLSEFFSASSSLYFGVIDTALLCLKSLHGFCCDLMYFLMIKIVTLLQSLTIKFGVLEMLQSNVMSSR